MAGPFSPSEVEAKLAAYYDQEGPVRLERKLGPLRVGGRQTLLDALERRSPDLDALRRGTPGLDALRRGTPGLDAATPATASRVLEIGSGPGTDAIAFVETGLNWLAIDLSLEHARCCKATGAAVAVASARRLPFRAESFDAVWSMSTLMHVPNSAIDTALSEVARVLRPGGVAAIGVWGGPDTEEEERQADGPPGLPRLFSRRSNERWRSLLARWFTIEDFQAWNRRNRDYFYQWALLRKEGG